jgi:hypothetical protein
VRRFLWFVPGLLFGGLQIQPALDFGWLSVTADIWRPFGL